MTEITVLALDPAFRNVGYTLATLNIKTGEFAPFEIGLIKTQADNSKKVRKGSDTIRCGKEIFNTLEALIDIHSVKYVFAEVPVGSQNAAAARLLGAATGILACLSKPMIEVSPKEVKDIVGLGGKPTKKQMITWAMGKYPDLDWFLQKSKGEMVSVDGKNEHIADSVGVLEAALVSEQWRGILTAISAFI